MKLTGLFSRSSRTAQGRPAAPDHPPTRIAVCGEVSSGKSTLLNTLLRAPVLSDNIGASRRPVIHVNHGSHAWAEVHHAGKAPVAGPTLEDLDSSNGCERIGLWSPETHLAGFEFVEIPFTTADEMTDAQRELVGSSQIMVWMTIASQAWRFTEKTLVERLGDSRPKNCIIAVSRADKLQSLSDRDRIQSRLERETGYIFQSGVFIDGDRALLDGARSDDVWARTAAPQLIEILRKVQGQLATESQGAAPARDVDASPFDTSRLNLDGSALPPSEPKAAPKRQKRYRGVVYDEDPTPSQPAPASTETWTLSPAPATPQPVAPAVQAEAIPAQPTPEARDTQTQSVSKPASRNLPVPDSAICVGVIPPGGSSACDVLKGDLEACRSMARVVDRAMANVIGNYSFLEADAGAASGVAIATKRHRLVFEVVPSVGVVFMLFDGQKTNLASLNGAVARLCESLVAA